MGWPREWAQEWGIPPDSQRVKELELECCLASGTLKIEEKVRAMVKELSSPM
jgi:hypothetical protein